MRTSLLALLLLLPLQSFCQETAAFLKIGVGARALGMGGAYTAMANDVNSMAWNPAGLASFTKQELGATHAELAADTRYDFLGYARPTRMGTIGAAAAYLSQGALEGRDENGKPMGGYSASDQAVNLSFASRFMETASLGASVKYIRSSIANVSAQTYAVDLGGQYALGFIGPGVPMLALAVQNMGPGMKFLDQTSQLPLTMAAGIAYRMPMGFVVAMDFKNRPYSHTSEFCVGSEYAMFSNFTLRSGYNSAKAYNSATNGIAALNGIATGLGLKFYGYNLDYAFTPFGELGNAQRLSLGTRF